MIITKTSPCFDFLEEYQSVLRLVAEQLDRDPDYAIGLLEPAAVRILLEYSRRLRDSETDPEKKTLYAKKASFFSKGSLEDKAILRKSLLETEGPKIMEQLKKIL
jgi:hypothetical protein